MPSAFGVNALLIGKYFEALEILRELPASLRIPSKVDEKMKTGTNFVLEVPRGIVPRYERLLESIKDSVRRDAPPLPSWQQLQLRMFAIRLFAVALAFADRPALAMLASTGQYLVAPCSFFMSVAMFIALAPPLFVGHYAVWGVLQNLSTVLLPWWLRPSLPINMVFILLLLVLDQALCLRLSFATPQGLPQKLSGRALFEHVWYGFLNCKSYELLILLCARSWGCRVDLLVWLVDAQFGLTAKASAWAEERISSWAFLFYTQHRMGHLPRVYESAHKFHHTFVESSAFDAHIYGSGMPEELFCIFAEVLGCRLGLCPMSLGIGGLTQSWENKLGHQRKADGQGGLNAHADHHKEHVKNYGIFNPLLDMLFGTSCNCTRNVKGSWEVLKTETDDVVRFEWTKTSEKDSRSYCEKALAHDLLNMLLNRW